jgi:hypothetical protein
MEGEIADERQGDPPIRSAATKAKEYLASYSVSAT